MDELYQLFQEYNTVLEMQQFEEAGLDYNLVEKHIDFLTQLDVIENSAISVFDLFKKEHVFVSENYSKMLKYNLAEFEIRGNDFFNSRVHPDDFMVNLKIGTELIRHSYRIPVAERKNYKVISDYRVKNGNGEYIRIIEQHQALELDKKGNIWLALSTVDVSPNQDLTGGVKCIIFNTKTGKTLPYSFANKQKDSENFLSKREQEVLSLVKDGLPSKEIAERLFISIHTVNTHRQRILEKLNVSNSYEAIQYAARLGLLE
jgi:DNA-binding CsgD family transcriptional regulator/PAS domain-containing protein